MPIVSITITRNDWQSLEQWKKFYDCYKGILYKHIIVDNASESAYKERLRELFPSSVLIERTSNGGTTAAYNDGIKYALADVEVDAIMLIANDIKIDKAGIESLYNKLLSDESIGAVAPVLLQGDEKTICTYGENLRTDMGLQRLHEGRFLDATLPDEMESQCLPGGMNMVRSTVYRTVGFQDESLFMYMDENDFFHRTVLAGYRLVTIKEAVSAHCHIAVEKGRHGDSGLAFFYIYRNHLLVCRQYAPLKVFARLALRYLFITIPKYSLVFVFEGSFGKIYYSILGVFCGVLGVRNNFVKR